MSRITGAFIRHDRAASCLRVGKNFKVLRVAVAHFHASDDGGLGDGAPFPPSQLKKFQKGHDAQLQPCGSTNCSSWISFILVMVA